MVCACNTTSGEVEAGGALLWLASLAKWTSSRPVRSPVSKQGQYLKIPAKVVFWPPQVHTHARTPVYMSMCTHTCIPTYMNMCACTYTYMHEHVRTYIYAYIHEHVHTCIPACMSMCTHTCMYTFICEHMHTCIHKRAHTHTCTPAHMNMGVHTQCKESTLLTLESFVTQPA